MTLKDLPKDTENFRKTPGVPGGPGECRTKGQTGEFGVEKNEGTHWGRRRVVPKKREGRGRRTLRKSLHGGSKGETDLLRTKRKSRDV